MTQTDGYLAGHRLVVPEAAVSALAVSVLREAGADVDTTVSVSGLFGIHPTNIGFGVFAESLSSANRAVSVLAADPTLPSWPLSTRFAASLTPTVMVPDLPQLDSAASQLADSGATVLRVDPNQKLTTADRFEAFVVPTAAGSTAGRQGVCAVSVPDLDGLTVIAEAHHDAVAVDVASMLSGCAPLQWVWPSTVAQSMSLVVFGAHLRGEPLEFQLRDLGARWAGDVQTAPRYRMTVLPTQPPKPGVLRVSDGGTSLHGQRWTLSPAALGIFLAQLPAPMQLGQVELADGSWEVGFGCDASAAVGPDISGHGGWLAAKAAGAV